jgi:hypothetical protein
MSESFAETSDYLNGWTHLCNWVGISQKSRWNFMVAMQESPDGISLGENNEMDGSTNMPASLGENNKRDGSTMPANQEN